MSGDDFTYVHVRDANNRGWRFLCEGAAAECARIKALIAANPDMRELEVNAAGGDVLTLTFDARVVRCFVGPLTPTVFRGTMTQQANGRMNLEITDVREGR